MPLIMVSLNDILRLELENMLVFHLSLVKGLLAILSDQCGESAHAHMYSYCEF